MLNRRQIMAVTLMVLVAAISVAQQPSLSIQYENKQIYIPGSDVMVKFTVRNDSPETYRFKLAENRIFNVEFDVRSLSNVPLEPAAEFTVERTSNQQIYYRDVALQPEEEFSFTENLGDFIAIDDSGVFVVRAYFYPGLIGNPGSAVLSNALSLSIRPPLSESELTMADIDDRTGEILTRESLPPDQIVAYTIDGLQDGAWNRYFLYVDLEGLYRSNPNRERSLLRLSEEAQRRAIDQFRTTLTDALQEPELTAIPSSYELVRTSYDQQEATVIMDLRFRNPRFTEIKRYTYFLHKRDSVWYIYDYAVTNLGTE